MGGLNDFEIRFRQAEAGDGRKKILNDQFDVWANLPVAEALKFSQAAIVVSRELNDSEALALALRFHGINAFGSSDYPGALTVQIEALALFESLEDISQITACQIDIGCSYTSLSDYTEAMRYFEAALELGRRGSRGGMAFSLHNLGSLQNKLGNHAEALQIYQQSLEILREMNDQRGVAYNLCEIGKTQIQIGETKIGPGLLNADFFSALENLEASLVLARLTEEKQLVVEALLGLAGAQTRLENFVAAKAAIEEALQVAEFIGDAGMKARCLMESAHVQATLGNLKPAMLLLTQAQEVFLQINAKNELSNVHKQLAALCKTMGDFPKALENFERFYEIDAEIRSDVAERRAQALSVRLDVEKTKHESELHRLRSQELSELNQRLQTQAFYLDKQAREDGLTGLANRRHFEELAAMRLLEAKSTSAALTVVIADIDYFKKINDQFSHAMGDQTLKVVASILRRACRDSDLVARYGGEEFVLLLPDVSANMAFDVCERVRLEIQNFDWPRFAPQLKVTMSFGLCDDTTLDNHERMLAVADACLYQAKNAGRNRIYPDFALATHQ